MDNNLFHINVFLDIDKTKAFIEEKIKDGSLTTDTVLSADMFDWETRKVFKFHCSDFIKVSHNILRQFIWFSLVYNGTVDKISACVFKATFPSSLKLRYISSKFCSSELRISLSVCD